MASLPATHPYVDAVRPPMATVVAAGRPVDPGWAPDPLWDTGSLTAHAAGIDVVHVHFGYDHLPPAALREWAATVRRLGLGLVVTVHDLRNPHHADPGLLDAQLQVLLPAADAVLTLTTGAADVVTARYGRVPLVVPHPAVFSGPSAPTSPGTVGIHLKSLRGNVVDPVRTVSVVADAVGAAGGRLQVDVHDDVLDRPEVRAIGRRLAGHPHATLRPHARFDDAALQAWLSGLAVSVLVNRFGTHSGWVEACHDVGTTVVAPDCGFYAEQWPDLFGYGHDEAHGLDTGSLHRAVTAALAAPPAAPADRGRRAAQLSEVHDVHGQVYARCARR